MWYSDDGQSYKVSQQSLPKMDEAQLVQNGNGTVIANMRHRAAPARGRAVALSEDGGASFGSIVYDAQLPSPVCQASIIRSAQNGEIYFANPATSSGRTHGKVRRSPTGLPGSWTSSLDVTEGKFAYSCLTDVPQQGMLGLLWEQSPNIVFSLLPLEF